MAIFNLLLMALFGMKDILHFFDTINPAVSLVGIVITGIITYFTYEISQKAAKLAEESNKFARDSNTLAYRAYHQIDREAPWSITKIDDKRWLLERLHMSKSTIYGYITDSHSSDIRIEWVCGKAAYPVKSFRRTDKMILKIEGTFETTEICLLYREYEDNEYINPKGDYHGQLPPSHTSELPDYVKPWSTPIYK